MSVLQYILLSLALAMPVMVAAWQSASKKTLRLTRGLLLSFLVAVVHAVAAGVGLWVGILLRFDLPSVDSAVYLGLLVLVAVRLMLSASKKRVAVAYDLEQGSMLLLLPLATCVNALLAGLAVGFVADFKSDGAGSWCSTPGAGV